MCYGLKWITRDYNGIMRGWGILRDDEGLGGFHGFIGYKGLWIFQRL